MSLKEIKGTDFKYVITFNALLCNKEPKCFAERLLHEQSRFIQNKLYVSEQDID